MIFKRKETFRFEFGQPLEANYVVLIDGKPMDLERTQHSCQILDISPRGIKMFSNDKIGEHNNKPLQLEVSFILDEAVIRAIAEIVWAKPYANGFQYGLIIPNQPIIENLIVNELKIRRRKEVIRGKAGK
jgi:hypothetical protein